MDSLLFLCARRIIAQRSLPTLPPHPCPVLFQVAFLDRRPLVLQNLVATWPFTELNFQRLVGQRELLRIHTRVDCIQAIIQGVVMQLQRGLEESSLDSSLRVLNMTGLPAGSTISFSTEALAKACIEVSKHQQEFQRRRPKRHKDCSSDAMTVATQQPLVVDVHTDLSVNRESFEILRDALQVGAAGPLRLKCREFEGERISASQIVTLLESLDPSCLRRVDLRFNNLGLTGLLEILPHLSRFPELCSLKLQHSNVHLQHLTPESATRIRCVARQLGMLPRLRELNLRSSQLSWNLHKILCDLQAPLESLELASCSLVPDDLTFLSQSFHAPALKRLDLSGHDFSQSQGLLEPLQHLLEETSASLLHLDLLECHMADSHLKALLPTLQRCSRLRFLGLYGNSLSTAMLKDLLQKTLELPDLHLVVYPFPVDCYKRVPPGPWWKLLVEDKELFAAAKAEFSQMLVNSGRTDLDWTCTPLDCRALDYFSL